MTLPQELHECRRLDLELTRADNAFRDMESRRRMIGLRGFLDEEDRKQIQDNGSTVDNVASAMGNLPLRVLVMGGKLMACREWVVMVVSSPARIS
jgi:hypothetical protein